jgi:imidazolonepropionase-like amidohydrolase
MKKVKHLILTCLALCFLQTAYAQTPQQKYSFLITNANIVDVIDGKILKNKLLAISNDTIKDIADAKMVHKYQAEQYIDATGKFILPGLWDMHVHFRGGDTLIEANKALLPLYLVYGITTVRDAGGDITPAIMQWREQIQAGTLAGPKIFTSGPKIDGPEPSWSGSIEVETPEQVRYALDSLQKIKVDYVKIYDSKISREAYLNTVLEAQKRGLKVTSHLPVSVKLLEAVDAGLDAVEHMHYILIAASPKEDSLFLEVQKSLKAGTPLTFSKVLEAAFKSYNATTATQLYRFLAEKKMAVVPTVSSTESFLELIARDHAADLMLSYIDPRIQATYQMRIIRAKDLSKEEIQFRKSLHQLYLSMIPRMHAAGVTLLAGSDSGPYNSYNYPGVSLHNQLKLLGALGFSPLQALQTATINAARFMTVENFYGSVEKGKSFDLIILHSNPLKDINAIDSIHGMIANKHYYTQKDLDQLLGSIKY